MAHAGSVAVTVTLALLAAGCAGSAPGGGDGAPLPVPPPDASLLSPRQQAGYAERFERLAAEPTAERHGELGKQLLSDGFAASAEPCFRNAMRLDPQRFDWVYYLAHVTLGAGRHEEAIELFERAVEMRSDDVASWVWLGNARHRLPDYDGAAAAFEQALALNPESASAHLGLGRTRLAQQRYRDAIDELEQALELAPGATIAHYPLAQAYRGAGDAENAQRHLALRGDTEAYPRDPLMEEIRTQFGSPGVLTDRGGSAYSRGEFESAADSFRRVVELVPDHPIAHANLAAALFESGDTRGAEREFARAHELDPADPAVLYSLGVLRRHAGDVSGSEKFLREAIARDPAYLPARLELGHALRSSGDSRGAEAEYRAVIDVEPRRAEAQWGLAMTFVDRGDWKGAAARLETCVSLLPDQPAFAHALARVLAAAPDEAVRNGERALQLLDPLLRSGAPSTDVGETLAMALAASGDTGQAAEIESRVLDAARGAGAGDTLRMMERRLAAFRAGRVWSEPWPAGHPALQPPLDAEPAPPRRTAFES